MSCYEWERGSVKIPAKEWPKFRTRLIQAWNARRQEIFDISLKEYRTVKANVKGKRQSVRREALKIEWDRVRTTYATSTGHEDYSYEVVRNIFDRNCDLNPKEPKKKDAGLLPTSRDASFGLDDWTIGLRNDTRTLDWHVSENNHAVETSHRGAIPRLMMRLLGQMTFTRGTGGEFISSDEYAYEAGDGAGVTHEFGPRPKRAAWASW